MIIDIEGIPGSGKTYCAEQKQISIQNALVFYEHTSENIIDITRKAFIPNEVFDLLIEKITPRCKLVYGNEYESYGLKKIFSKTTSWNQYKILSLLEIGYTDKMLNDEITNLCRYEITCGRVTFEKYQEIALGLFQQLDDIDVKGKYLIFEGAFFQNLLFDIIAFYCLDDEKILSFYRELKKVLHNHSVKITMINVNDVERCIYQAAAERINNTPLWIDNFSYWLSHSPYGMKLNLSGINGVVSFCEELQRIMILICKSGLFENEIISRRV